MTPRPTLDTAGAFEHPLYGLLERTPGLTLGLAAADELLAWGLTNSLWVFPMATSCCGIELMAAAASRVDLDRMGTIVRASPRHADVMVVAGTITVKMAPRVKLLWEQMPEPKWCLAMGSCAISGDFYRDLYSVVPGIDLFLPVDVYVPGCPPGPEALMHGLLRLQEKVRSARKTPQPPAAARPELLELTRPRLPRVGEPARTRELDEAQARAAAEATREQVRAPLVIPADGAAADGHAAATEGAGAAAAQRAQAALEALVERLCTEQAPREGPPLVGAAQHVELARRLQQRGYEQLVTMVATHWPAGTGRMGVAGERELLELTVVLRRVGPASRTAAWSVAVAPEAALPTLAGVFAGADWQEREQWDLLGLRFCGHPDLRRLMLPEDWQGHPLRKEQRADQEAAPWR